MSSDVIRHKNLLKNWVYILFFFTFNMVKADLHMHGAIGFQDYWLRLQRYEGKNLLQLIADRCFERDIGICAITSEEIEIPKGSVHDRLGYLMQFIPRLSFGYKVDKLGDNVLVLEKEGKLVYLVNGQTVIARDNFRRYDHLVVGSNRVPNLMTLDDTFQFGEDNGLIQIAEHPFVENHFGIGLERLERYVKSYDAIEGHNAQIWFSFITRSNEHAINFAIEHNKPFIAVSDAHRIKDLGIAYIDLQRMPDVSSEERFLRDLKSQVSSGEFGVHTEYVSIFGFLDWVSKFRVGIFLQQHEENRFYKEFLLQ